MVRNIIEDSDDEGDFGSLSPVANRRSSPAPIHPPNEKTPTRSQKSLPGTGSTEELRREIAAAHRDVIDKSAAPNDTTNSPDGTTRWRSPTSTRKRKSTLSSLNSHDTPRTKKIDRRKSARTYGQSEWGDYSLFGEGDNAFEAMKQDDTTQHKSKRGGLNLLIEDEPLLQTSEEYLAVNHQATLPKMPSSLREDFAGHDPAVMFPMTMSSTVPDATLDQQRLLEAARAEHEQNRISALEQREQSFSDIEVDDGSQAVKNHTVSTCDELGERDELGEESLPSFSKALPRQGRSSRTEDNITKSQRVVEQSIQESIHAVRASKARKAQETNTSDVLNSDDLAIGLPKEKYVPRPSRSRSVRSPVAEPDYSVLPEKVAKQKTKRRKTGDAIAVQGHNNFRPESMFTKETSVPAKEESTAPPADVPLPAFEQTQGNAPTQKRKRGRPPRKRQEEPTNSIADEQHATDVTEKSQLDEVGKLHHVMPSADENEDEAQFITHTEQQLHDPDFKDDGLHERLPSPVVRPTPSSSARVAGEVQQVEGPKQKKRGRGRPRATQNEVRGAAATDVDELQPATKAPPYYENEQSHETQPDTGLEGGKSHDSQKIEGGVEEATLGTADDAAPALGSSRPSGKASEEHEVWANQKAAAEGGCAKPSPLGKGKVPVRVGLSRRARIAPLLKIVKK
ncbi:hypothetical protein SLS58_004215 [Diplodia intermedia]|uniref:Uncharacterized protein n=1 Tax=Diplodia intermedia TaxID=856260 RepID=A0ABR3TV03_9PEZI